VKERLDPLRGSGLFRGRLWLSRGERAALEALGDAGPYILRGGFVWGWRAIGVQAAMVAVMLLPWVYYLVDTQAVFDRDSVEFYVLYGLFGLPMLHVVLMVVVDAMQARRVGRLARQLNVRLTAMDPAAVAMCAVLPQRLALRGAILAAALPEFVITALAVSPAPAQWEGLSFAATVCGVATLWRAAVLLGPRGAVDALFVRNWPTWGRGFWGSARASFLAHLLLVPPVLASIILLDRAYELPWLLFILGYPMLISFGLRERYRGEPFPGFDEWCFLREAEG
jgi:hypothetical protein